MFSRRQIKKVLFYLQSSSLFDEYLVILRAPRKIGSLQSGSKDIIPIVEEVTLFSWQRQHNDEVDLWHRNWGDVYLQERLTSETTRGLLQKAQSYASEERTAGLKKFIFLRRTSVYMISSIGINLMHQDSLAKAQNYEAKECFRRRKKIIISISNGKEHSTVLFTQELLNTPPLSAL
ncbi:hypothetical protein Tco_0675864 [Tanacetum coccineum]